HNNGEHHYEAELYRLQGELLLKQDVPDEPEAESCLRQAVDVARAHKGELLLKQDVPDEPEAESCLRQAVDVARQQQAKSLELRAAVGLSRLWQHQGKRVRAHDLLAPIYGWVTEVFDTPALQEAKALLDVLA